MDQPSLKTMKLYHQVERVFTSSVRSELAPTTRWTSSNSLTSTSTTNLAPPRWTRVFAVWVSWRACRCWRWVVVSAGRPGISLTVPGAKLPLSSFNPISNETAVVLTDRCGLGAKVNHVCGDILAGAPRTEHYDALVSWLTFLHIPTAQSLCTMS